MFNYYSKESSDCNHLGNWSKGLFLINTLFLIELLATSLALYLLMLPSVLRRYLGGGGGEDGVGCKFGDTFGEGEVVCSGEGDEVVCLGEGEGSSVGEFAGVGVVDVEGEFVGSVGKRYVHVALEKSSTMSSKEFASGDSAIMALKSTILVSRLDGYVCRICESTYRNEIIGETWDVEYIEPDSSAKVNGVSSYGSWSLLIIKFTVLVLDWFLCGVDTLFDGTFPNYWSLSLVVVWSILSRIVVGSPMVTSGSIKSSWCIH
ncbi:hypothetical protein Tco_0215833 [Tanacetum coccineum]